MSTLVAELLELDRDSSLLARWIGEYRARWAAHRAAASVRTGDGGAWLDGAAARRIACDAIIVPVVTGDIDPAAVEDLIGLCVRYHALRVRTTAPGDPDDTQAPEGTHTPDDTKPRDGTDIRDSGNVGGGAAVPAGLIGRTARQGEQAAAVRRRAAGRACLLGRGGPARTGGGVSHRWRSAACRRHGVRSLWARTRRTARSDTRCMGAVSPTVRPKWRTARRPLPRRASSDSAVVT